MVRDKRNQLDRYSHLSIVNKSLSSSIQNFFDNSSFNYFTILMLYKHYSQS